MAERRLFPRVKKRIFVSFDVGRHSAEGFTYDISPTGIFVRSVHFPRPGTQLKIRLKPPVGQRILLHGTVVRTYRVPARLTAFVPSGFSVRLLHPPEEYFQLLARLFRIAA